MPHLVSKYLNLVRQIYEMHKQARDNDAILTAFVLASLFGAKSWKDLTLRDYLFGVYKGSYPSLDTITRAGRRVRQLHPELRGTANARQRREAKRLVTLNDLEYTGPPPQDANQLHLFTEAEQEQK